MSIPTSFLTSLKLYNPLIENWAFVIGVILSLFFYLRLGFWYFMQMAFVILLSIAGNNWIQNNFHLLTISLILFVVAWIGQFYGHKVEGKKPSFIKDLQFLLIGPLWVIQKLSRQK